MICIKNKHFVRNCKKIWTMALAMVVLISVQFVPVDVLAQGGQTGGDFDPVDLLERVQETHEKSLKK